jgi:hypothetical protein
VPASPENDDPAGSRRRRNVAEDAAENAISATRRARRPRATAGVAKETPQPKSPPVARP